MRLILQGFMPIDLLGVKARIAVLAQSVRHTAGQEEAQPSANPLSGGAL
jgi:hypothetical protein